MNRITHTAFAADRSGLTAVAGCCGVGGAAAPAAAAFGFSWAGVYQSAFAAAVTQVAAEEHRRRFRAARATPGLN